MHPPLSKIYEWDLHRYDQCYSHHIFENILIYSDNISEHKLHVWEVPADSALTDFFSVQTNASFHVTSCEYLGYMLSPEGLTMARTKSRLSRLPVPWKVKDIQSFSGFANFYHRFIYGYSKSQSRSCIFTTRVPHAFLRWVPFHFWST